MKNWVIGCVGFVFFALTSIKPSLITKYGYTNSTIDNIVRAFSILLFLLWIIPYSSLFLDSVNYFSKGDNYLINKECTVEKKYSSVWFFFAQKRIRCEDSSVFVDTFTGRFFYEGDVFKITYLPDTKLIVKAEKLN